MTGSNPAACGFVVAQAGAGGGLVEDLHHLGAEAAGELPVPAEGVLPGDPALLVRGGAQRQVGLAEQPVVGDRRSPRRRTRPAGWSASSGSTAIAPLTPSAAPASAARVGLGADADDDQDHVGRRGSRPCRRPRRPGPAAVPVRPGAARLIGLDGGAGQDLHAVGGELGVHERAELRVDGGQHLGRAVPSG